MVGLGWRHEPERPPEAGHTVPRLAAHHPLAPEMDRRVRIDLEQEDIEVVRRTRWPRQVERCRQVRMLGPGGLTQDAEHADHLGRTAHGTGAGSSGSRYTSRPGLSGRISQYGRRVPSGELLSAGRVSASQRR